MHDRLQSSKCALYLKALGDPDRLRIMQALQTGRRSVTELTELLSKEMANVSHHLGVLRNAGLVQTTREGRHIFYSLADHLVSNENPSQTGQFDLGCCRLEWEIPDPMRQSIK